MVEPTQVLGVNAPGVIGESIDGEVVVINLDSGIYYSIEKVGADLWGMLEDGCTLEEMTETVAGSYTGERSYISGAISDFVAELQTERLIVPQTDSRHSPAPIPPAGAATDHREFEPPSLNKYEDMQDLLLLDPIHEVDNTGWPTPKLSTDTEE